MSSFALGRRSTWRLALPRGSPRGGEVIPRRGSSATSRFISANSQHRRTGAR
jgi:hypothetical protein